MPYKLFNGNTNIVSDLITKRRKEYVIFRFI